ncbi:uncharacterized protein LOC116350677 [Contarinia nasturtii]|uniref:uncharacterized protein LOC116350677 n=1 Tax=Contarinia nasturtii TaxID=265458 RepID=UPI0012D43E7A|nr:uncharacterized protein LOC116350677 [Contarinia nasturtii]XP_031638419.1 uncharacterized protein LOC116350677 [Contarinia nasturtii]
MEGERFSWFAKNYLRKRPRLSPTSFPDDQMASTSSCMPSTSTTSNQRPRIQRILIEPSDEQLLKWQERQISECIVENTVNQMVESYLTFIEGENANSGTRNELDREAHIASYNAYRAQENFEDSAIVWAIDQYGLQQHHQSFFNDNRNECMSTSSSSISLSSPPHLQTQDDLCFFGIANDKDVTNVGTQTEKNIEENDDIQVNVYQKSVAPNAKEQNDENSSVEPQQSAGEEAINDEHFDFMEACMEAAVAVAIQEKGLTSSYTMQKSPKR